jgi:hypothetical protein
MAILCIALGVFPMQTVWDFCGGTLDLMLAHVANALAVVG